MCSIGGPFLLTMVNDGSYVLLCILMDEGGHINLLECGSLVISLILCVVDGQRFNSMKR